MIGKSPSRIEPEVFRPQLSSNRMEYDEDDEEAQTSFVRFLDDNKIHLLPTYTPVGILKG